ncbi:MAG: M23 family metallopeptidase [Clostridium sp.]
MDNNKKDKVKDFFKKEGFYVALFLCLCVVATVAAVTMKSNKKPEQAKNSEKEFSLNLDNNDVTREKQNAERVEAETKSEVDEVADVTIEEDVNVAAGTTTEVIFTNPIEGAIAREFSYPEPKEMKDGSFRNIKGIDIVAEVGTPVKSSAEGIVEVVGNDVEEGSFVIIAHANGIKTKYANLDKEVLVEKGDAVTTETVVGNVGDSSKIFNNKDFGEHINIQVLDSNDKQMDPTKYFNY